MTPVDTWLAALIIILAFQGVWLSRRVTRLERELRGEVVSDVDRFRQV